MKLISRYLYKEILHYFLIFVSFYVVVLLITQAYDMLPKFLSNDTPISVIIEYLACSMPKALADVAPMITLTTCMFAYGVLAKNREILAMVAAGIGFRRLALPAATFGLGMTVFLFWFHENVVPPAQERALYIEQVVISGRSETIFTRRSDLMIKGAGNRFYLMKEYRSNRNEMVYPTIIDVAADGVSLDQRIEAVTGRLEKDSGDEANYWVFEGAQRWTFDEAGSIASYHRFDGPYRLKMEEGLDRFLSKSKKPDEMNFGELYHYRDLMQRKGGENFTRFTMELWRKMAFPFACLLNAVLGFAVVAEVYARHFARGVTIGLVMAISYYVFEALLHKLGDESHVGPVVAAVTPTIVYGLVTIYMMHRMEHSAG